MKKVIFQASLPVSILREGNRFVAYTPVLDISTSGKTHKEARDRFVELSGIFFEEIINAGTIDEVLSDAGWKKRQSTWKPPVVVSQESQEIRVPA